MTPRVLAFSLLVGLTCGGVATAQQRRPKFALPDSIKASLDLPRVTEGTVALPAKGPVVEIGIVPKREEYRIYLDGQERSLRQSLRILFRFAELSRDTSSELKPSKIPVVLYGGGNTPWREYQWLMQVCADPDVRIWRIYIAVESGDGVAALPVFLPSDRPAVPEKTGSIPVALERIASEKKTQYCMLDQTLGVGDTGFVAFKKAVKRILEKAPDARVDLNGWPRVPVSDVARVVAALRAMGVKDLVFRGTAFPGSKSPKREKVVWRLPDGVRSKIAPPGAKNGMKRSAGGPPCLEVAVTGPGPKLVTGGGEQTAESLKALIAKVSVGRRDSTGRPMLSLVPILVYANPDTAWKDVRTILRVCADRQVLANRISFVVRDGDEEKILPVWLPVGDPPKGVAWLKVDLDPTPDAGTRVALHGQALGSGKKGFARLGEALRSVRGKYPDRVIYGQISPADDVPYGDVVRATDELRSIRITNLSFLSR